MIYKKYLWGFFIVALTFMTAGVEDIFAVSKSESSQALEPAANSETSLDAAIQKTVGVDVPAYQKRPFTLKRDPEGNIDASSLTGGFEYANGPNPHLNRSVDEYLAKGKSAKVHSSLRRKLASKKDDKPIRILLYLKDQSRITEMDVSSKSKKDRSKYVIDTLKDKAWRSQRSVVSKLQDKKIKNEVSEFKEYWIVNMVSATVKKEVVEELAADPAIEAIYEDRLIPAPRPVAFEQPVLSPAPTLSPSPTPSPAVPAEWGVDRVRARELWAQGFQGRGIVVGSIDTGVDDSHPSLRGQMANMGNGRPGWVDFNTNSPIPIDDNGHGTHTLGTMVGTAQNSLGRAIGVAPEAKYYSARVFGPNEAFDSMFLAAGQWMLDPDGNPATDDQPQIVNNSWGSSYYGSANPWYRDMVRNWRSAGIMPVFASGNSAAASNFRFFSGFGGYWSVADPGNYPESFTVGASDNENNVAPFSSRGPSTYDGVEGIIKPDLVAPGVAVVSALAYGTDMYGDGSHFVGSDLYSASGTSMAAPHAAGAAALLMQKHPDWSMDEVEAAMVGKAAPLQKVDAYSSGAGLLDVASADKAQVVFLPRNFSLGRDDTSLDEWSAVKSFDVRNLTHSQKICAMGINTGTLPWSAVPTLEPANFWLGDRGKQTVTLNLTVNNLSTPNAQGWPNAYQGRLQAKLQDGTMTAGPLAFLKGPTLLMNRVGDYPEIVAIYKSDELFYWTFVDFGTSVALNLPFDGTYTLISTWYPEPTFMNGFRSGFHAVVHDQVSIGQRPVTETLSMIEANNTLNLNLVDIEGTPLSQYWVTSHLGPSGVQSSSAGLLVYGGFQVSNFSHNTTWNWKVLAEGSPGPEDIYSFSGSALRGVSGPVNWENSPEDFRHVTVRTHSVPEGGVSTSWSLRTASEDTVWQMHVMPRPGLFYNLPDTWNVSADPAHLAGNWPLTYSPAIFSLDQTFNGYLVDDAHYENPAVTVPDGASWDLGLGPFFSPLKTKNSATVARVQGYFLRSQMMDAITAECADAKCSSIGRYVMRGATGQLVSSGPFPPTGSWSLSSPGSYHLTLSKFRPYDIRDSQGDGSLTLRFDTLRSDKNPPSLTRFQIVSDDKLTDTVHGRAALSSVRFNVTDDTGPVYSAKLWYSFGFLPDRELPLVSLPGAGDYEAVIPQDISGGQDGYVTLKVQAEDASGNTMEYRMDPAFFFSYSGKLPPEFESINKQETDVTGGLELTVRVQARDPAGETLTLSACFEDGSGLETIGANFSDHGDGSGTLTWVAPSRQLENPSLPVVFTASNASGLTARQLARLVPGEGRMRMVGVVRDGFATLPTPMAGVTLVIKDNNNQIIESVVTDAQGYYYSKLLLRGRYYHIRPSLAHHTFEPNGRVVYLEDGPPTRSIDFLAHRNEYPFRGYVRDAAGVGISGVTLKVLFNGSEMGQQTTNSQGYYESVYCVVGRDYKLVPSKKGYLFTPAEQTINLRWGGGAPPSVDFSARQALLALPKKK